MNIRTIFATFPLALALIAPACATEDEPVDPTGETEPGEPVRRQKIGKADLVGSCQGQTETYCGTKTGSGNCWCDAACTGFGDCCADYETTCVDTNECGEVLCELYCPYGFAKGEDGCDICACEAGPEDACGGFAGLLCPEGKICIDNPNDDCDPQNGGADCIGICIDEPEPAATCQDQCGGKGADGSCYCDEACTYYGDCCDDYEEACNDDRVPASGSCVKNGGETCTTDADCVVGGCGGALCYNPAFGGGFSTCECAGPGAPVAGCGCVQGTCTWYN
jgi:hypothetical protein